MSNKRPINTQTIDALEDKDKAVLNFDQLLAIYKTMYASKENRAFDKLNTFNKNHPMSKSTYKQMQTTYLKNNKNDGVFCSAGELKRFTPTLPQVFYSNSENVPNELNLYEEKLNERFSWFVTQITAFGAWRNTLGVYRIDPEIYQQSITSVIPPETPTTIFANLPDWCVYIELPLENPMPIINNRVPSLVLGFWAHLSNEVNDPVDGRAGKENFVLTIILDLMPSENDSCDIIVPISLIIKEGVSIEQSIVRTYEAADGIHATEQQKMIAQELSQMSKLLSLLLWLCAEEPDISNMKGEPITAEQMRLPKYGVNKKTGNFVPPNQTTVYEIGKRLGGEVREFNKQNGHSDARTSSRKRPHIRRGHWHGVWKGTGQDKQFDLYWQPAIFVNSKF